MINTPRRKHYTDRVIQRRVSMYKAFGPRQGTLYARHRIKIENSKGYLRDGNVTHYIEVTAHAHKQNRRKEKRDVKYTSILSTAD